MRISTGLFSLVFLFLIFFISCGTEEVGPDKKLCKKNSDCTEEQYCEEDEAAKAEGYKGYCSDRPKCGGLYDPDCPAGWTCDKEKGWCMQGDEPTDSDTVIQDEDSVIPDQDNEQPDTGDTDSVPLDNDVAPKDEDTVKPDTDSTPVDSFSDNFEDGSGKWIIDGTADCWQIGQPNKPTAPGPNAAPSPTHVAATKLEGNYPENADCGMTVSQHVTVPNDGSDHFLEFMGFVNTETDLDYAEILIRVDAAVWPSSGATVTSVDDVANSKVGLNGARNKLTGHPDEEYHKFKISLAPYKGKNIQFKFHFASDAETSGVGIFIDNVKVY